MKHAKDSWNALGGLTPGPMSAEAQPQLQGPRGCMLQDGAQLRNGALE